MKPKRLESHRRQVNWDYWRPILQTFLAICLTLSCVLYYVYMMFFAACAEVVIKGLFEIPTICRWLLHL